MHQGREKTGGNQKDGKNARNPFPLSLFPASPSSFIMREIHLIQLSLQFWSEEKGEGRCILFYNVLSLSHSHTLSPLSISLFLQFFPQKEESLGEMGTDKQTETDRLTDTQLEKPKEREALSLTLYLCVYVCESASTVLLHGCLAEKKRQKIERESSRSWLKKENLGSLFSFLYINTHKDPRMRRRTQ